MLTWKHIKNKGFRSIKGFRDYRNKINGLNNSNNSSLNLSQIISSALRILDKSQVWLARETGLTKQAINQYIHEKSSPCEDILNNIYSVLRVAFEEEYAASETLEEVLITS